MRERRCLKLCCLSLLAMSTAGCAFIADGAPPGLAVHDNAGDLDAVAKDAEDSDDSIGIVLADAVTADGDGSANQLPPQTLGPLFAWLNDGGYAGWAAESVVHKSAGPHSSIRVFANAALYESLSKAMAVHPVGAAAVKEIYDADATALKGWAVLHKIAADSAAGDGWYWFESLTKDGSAGVYASGPPAPSCIECHVDSAHDFIWSETFSP